MRMLIGYARLSTAGESLELQQQALDQAGVDQLFVDVASGAKAKHPQLERALSQLRKGDTLVVWRLDRLDRSVRNLVETVEDLGRRGIDFRSLTENIDTTTDTGKSLFHVFAALTQSERDLVQERSAAGRAAAKARGQLGGRRAKLDEGDRVQAHTLYQDPSNSVADICLKLRISRATLYRYLRQKDGRKAGGKPEAKTGAGLSTGQGRRVGENAPQTVDSPKHRATIARADSGSSHPPPASAVASPRPVATGPSRPRIRVPAEETAAQPPGFTRAWHRSARFAPRRREGCG